MKEFKKAKHQYKGSGSAKMSYYKELDELLKKRNKNAAYKSPVASKVDSYMQFADKGRICCLMFLLMFLLYYRDVQVKLIL